MLKKEDFLKPYEAQKLEPLIYNLWQKSGFFAPENLPPLQESGQSVQRTEPFTIVMPPPNANGHLHAGHALFITLEDIITRYKRMQGFKALWIPGADHAGFETQIVYEKKLEKEGRSRFKMEPEDLFNEIMTFTLENKKHMEDEVKSLGASCDWSREKFTLDPDIIQKVQKTFEKMFNDGLVYRGKRIINWCTKHQTSLSDVETDWKEYNDKLYYIKYGPLVVATVRPETIFGDVAVAVHPEDVRYKKYINTAIEVETPVGVMRLPVIADSSVESEFGTGALKITPAHDTNDFKIAQKHNLPSVETIDKYGKLTEKAGKYAGMKIVDARKAVVDDLKSMNLLAKEPEDYFHAVSVCFKCENPIEPRIMDQWFVSMKPLAELAMQAVREKRIQFIPANYEKIFFHWMQNALDWNISRQIVWGIPIPAKICDACGKGFPDLQDQIKACPACKGAVRKETDTFDTWFSSGQWPFLVTGYPKSEDFKLYYPTDVMETGHDLIFKWVPRMIIFGLYVTKDVPFRKVYLHGLVNDAHGKKMSKSKGNVISPLDLTQKYGTDSLRMALIVGNTPGTDLALSEDKIKAYKHFSNKIWNASRFVLENTQDLDISAPPALSKQDQQILSELKEVSKEVTEDMENFKFYLAAEKLYHYFWHTFADKIIEEAKLRLKGGDAHDAASAQYMLREVLTTALKLLHPFMPFVTEAVWSQFQQDQNLLMVEKWPS